MAGGGHQPDFNPRSREGSDPYSTSWLLSLPISIHAPVKGATRASGPLWWRPAYFNPRSREGSDPRRGIGRHDAFNFNPRSREGSDRRMAIKNNKHKGISIHAPVKGATLVSGVDVIFDSIFQSTLP